MLDDTSNQKRPRRSLEPDEISRLLKVVRLRPVAEFGRETVRNDGDNQPSDSLSRATWTKAPLNLATIDQAYERGKIALSQSPKRLRELERLGIERELLYRVLVTTGLRKGELASITLGQVYLDESPSWIELASQDEKAGRGASIPLRDNVAEQLREYLADRLRALQSESEALNVVSIAGTIARLPIDALLFTVPTNLVAILRRDMAAAGIAKIDERGRTVDVHAMRHTFSTMLHRAGVSPSVAQAAMRHSDIRLTMNTYNHLGLMDVVGAIESLPSIGGMPTNSESLQATGTDPVESSLTSMVTLAGVKTGQKLANSGNLDATKASGRECEKALNSLGKQGFFDERVNGFEPSTYSLGSYHSTN